MCKAVTTAILIVASCAFIGGNAYAAPAATETCSDTLDATIVNWTCEFEDLDYTLGSVLTLTVTWSVDQGFADYDWVGFRSYTPKAKNDPALGTDPVITYPGSAGDNSVDIAFTFVEMHTCKDDGVAIGNGHFKLYLRVDEDGDGLTDATAGFGVNVHAEDPQ